MSLLNLYHSLYGETVNNENLIDSSFAPIVGAISRTAAEGSGPQTIDGLPFKPRFIRLAMIGPQADENWCIGEFTEDLTDFYIGNFASRGVSDAGDSRCMFIEQGVGDSMYAVPTAVFEDGFTITWTEVGDGFDIEGYYFAYR